MTLHYITLHSIPFHCIALHDITLHYITLHYITLHYTTLHYTTLHYTQMCTCVYIPEYTYIYRYVYIYIVCHSRREKSLYNSSCGLATLNSSVHRDMAEAIAKPEGCLKPFPFALEVLRHLQKPSQLQE